MRVIYDNGDFDDSEVLVSSSRVLQVFLAHE